MKLAYYRLVLDNVRESLNDISEERVIDPEIEKVISMIEAVLEDDVTD